MKISMSHNSRDISTFAKATVDKTDPSKLRSSVEGLVPGFENNSPRPCGTGPTTLLRSFEGSAEALAEAEMSRLSFLTRLLHRLRRMGVTALVGVFSLLFSYGVGAQTDPTPPPLETAEARVVSVEGVVLVQPQPQERWIPAKEDMPLGANARVKTDPASSVQIAFEDSVSFQATVSENSDFQIEDLGPDKKMQLNRGRVYTEVEGLGSGTSFEVKTPSAVCGVRGTAWEVQFDGEETAVDTFEHEVYVQGLDKLGKPFGDRVFVKQGWATAVKRLGKPKPLFAMSKERMEKWQALRGKMQDRMANFRKVHPERFKKLGALGKAAKDRTAVAGLSKSGEKKVISPLKGGTDQKQSSVQRNGKTSGLSTLLKRNSSKSLFPFIKKDEAVQKTGSQESKKDPITLRRNKRDALSGFGGRKK